MDDIESRLAAVAPLVREQAAASERQREFTPEILRLLREGRFFRTWIAREYEGDEVALPDALRLFEGAAKLDGSFGWAVTIGTGGGLFSATLQPAFARAVFLPTEGVIAGSGTPGGDAREAPGGYRVSGRWRFASGSQYATWFTASVNLCDAAGEPRRDGSGPAVRAVAFEPGQVQVLDTWDALGMRATTSQDFEVHDVFVPGERMFDVFGEPRVSGALYRFPFLGIAETSFAAVALGVAAHGIEEFRELAREKRVHYSGDPLHENEVATARLAEAETSLAAAREAFYREATLAWERVEGGGTLDAATNEAITRVSILASEASMRALDGLFPLAGMAALFRDSAFGRCWRDLHTVSQHGLLTPARLA